MSKINNKSLLINEIIYDATTGFNCNFAKMYEVYVLSKDKQQDFLDKNKDVSKINKSNKKFVSYTKLIENDTFKLFEFMKSNGGFYSELSQKEFTKFNKKVCETIRGNSPYEYYYIVKQDGLTCFSPRLPMKGFRNTSKTFLTSKNKNLDVNNDTKPIIKSEYEKFCDIYRPRVVMEFIDCDDIMNMDKMINKRLKSMWISYQNPICIDLD